MNEMFLWDIAAAAWFLFFWIGYGGFATRRARHVDCLTSVRKRYLQRWIVSLSAREVRIADATLLTILERNVTFFASTSMLILVGLITGLGYTENLGAVIAGISFAVKPTPEMLVVKIMVLMVSFIYAFFTFTWSMRQFNYAAMMIGGTPLPHESENDRIAGAVATAKVLTLAATTFNAGLRAYYFSLATLAWFIHPGFFMITTIWVVLVLYRREFRSHTLSAMLHDSRFV